MSKRKSTLLLLSKLPKAGKVKTRLTKERDGLLTPEAARGLYHAMMLDVIEIAMAAIAELKREQGEGDRRIYDLVVSTESPDDVARMRKLLDDAGMWTSGIDVFATDICSFIERYSRSFERCFERGAGSVLLVRGDVPALTRSGFERGFRQLHQLEDSPRGGIVLAPDHDMGASIVGLTSQTDFSHENIFGNKEHPRVLPAYIHEAAKRGLPVLLFPAVPDVDTMHDLYHSATLVQTLNCSSHTDASITPPWRTAAALYRLGFSDMVLAPRT